MSLLLLLEANRLGREMCLVIVVVLVVFCPSSRFLISRISVRVDGFGLR